jgi:hypothetical protein
MVPGIRSGVMASLPSNLICSIWPSFLDRPLPVVDYQPLLILWSPSIFSALQTVWHVSNSLRDTLLIHEAVSTWIVPHNVAAVETEHFSPLLSWDPTGLQSYSLVSLIMLVWRQPLVDPIHMRADLVKLSSSSVGLFPTWAPELLIMIQHTSSVSLVVRNVGLIPVCLQNVHICWWYLLDGWWWWTITFLCFLSVYVGQALQCVGADTCNEHL